MTGSPALRIEFGPDASTVIMRARAEFVDVLRNLAPRFRTATLLGPGLLGVGLDDLMANILELRHWPSDVVWSTDLQRLVEGNLADADVVTGRLEDDDEPQLLVGDDEIEWLFEQGWTSPLTDCQRRDVRKLLSMNHGANFSVPGAGKTRVTLATFHALKLRGRVDRLLVVAPKSAFEAWRTENAESYVGSPLHMHLFEGTADSAADLMVANYERLPGNRPVLARWLSQRRAMLVLDEAHRMKLGDLGAYGSACIALSPLAERRMILTGTPAPNGARDLENLMGFVWPGHGRQVVARALAGGDLRSASEALRPLYTRTTKADLDLPPVSVGIRRLSMPPLHDEIYRALVGEMSARAANSPGDFEAMGRIVMYLLMAATSPALLSVGASRYDPLVYRVPPLEAPANASLTEVLADLPSYEFSPKYREALSIVAENASKGRKTIVWTNFVRSLNTLKAMLREFNPALVHGGVADADRVLELDRFRNDESCWVLLSNPATLGEGISLHHACHDAVYIDRDFAAGRYMQSLDRIHRLGLAPGVRTNITVLVTAETIDEVVERRLAMKLRFMGAVLDDHDVQELADLAEEPSVAGGLDMADLQSLLGHLDAKSSR